MMKINWQLILIVIFAAILRFIYLGQNPPGLYWDEVSLGYNAYSILKTGRDEHNRFLPLDTFKAFGDYKPPGYIYATVPSIWLFGLNNFAVRFPSALAGTLAVLLTYFLVKELFLFKKSKSSQENQHHLLLNRQKSNTSEVIAFVSALLLAISPWHLQLSRVAFEANLAATCNILAILLFLKSRSKPWWLIPSAISFIVAIYTFNANRILSFLLIGLLSLIYWRHLIKHLKLTLITAVIGIILILPLMPHLQSTEGKLRWNEVNIFSDLKVIITSNQQIAIDGGGRAAKLIHHRYLGHLANFARHYFDHFNDRYLFLKGDVNPRFSVQDVGELYLIELPFLLLGLYALTKLNSKKTAVVLFGWLLMAPIPAAMARETPHALRTMSTLPVPQILVALGLVQFINLVRQGFYKKFLALVSCFLFLACFIYFQIIYYHYYPKEYAGEWLTAYPALVRFINTSPEAQKASKITIIPDLGRPYIYFLFYNQYPPDKYMQTVNRTGDVFGFFTVLGFDKYIFERVDPNSIQTNDLYVVRGNETYAGFKLLETIRETNGYPQFNVLVKL